MAGSTNQKVLYQGQPQVSIQTPTTAPTLTTATNAGSTLAAGTYYVVYTWVDASSRETAKSPEASISVSSGNNLVVTLPAFPAGVSSANVYMSTSSGGETKQGSTSSTTYTQSTAINTGSAAAPTTLASGLTQQIYGPAPTNTISNPSPNATVIIKEIEIVNNYSVPAAVSIYAVPNGGSPGLGNIVIPQTTIGGSSGPDAKFISGIDYMLPAGATLQASQSVQGAITLTISGVEVQ